MGHNIQLIGSNRKVAAGIPGPYRGLCDKARMHAPGRPIGGWVRGSIARPLYMSTRKKLFSGIFALALVAAGVVFIFQANRGPRAETQKIAPAVLVTAAPVVLKDMPVRLLAIGNVEPFTTVAVKARADGQLLSVKFKEGDEVRQGAVLFEIDPRPYAATLKQAQANLLKDKALYDRAVEQDKRYKDLLAKNFISPDAYEQVRTNAATAAATLSADDAAIENAQLSLDYCTIRSPVTGYAGRIQIQQGNLVKANDINSLVTINQIVPIYASFSVPEQNIADIRKYQAAGELKVQAMFPNAAHAPVAGKLSFIDNSADMTTGTIKLKAEFPNTDKALWPGQFVNIVLTLYEQKDALVAPSAAVQNGPNGQYVYVVKPDMTVELRNIKILRAETNDTVVASGLQAGDQVVVVGQLRLAPGTKVDLGKGAQPS
jgi:multidrug efflux system membrane fusion protein